MEKEEFNGQQLLGNRKESQSKCVRESNCETDDIMHELWLNYDYDDEPTYATMFN